MNTTKKYLRNVRSSFPVFRKNERQFFDEFKLTVDEYKALYPECSMDDLNKKFGTPKEIVIDYFNNMDSEKYLSTMRKSLYIKISIVTTLVLFIIFFFLQTYLLFQARNNFEKSMIKTEEITIIQNEQENKMKMSKKILKHFFLH